MAFFQDTRPVREPFLNAPPTVLWLIAAIVGAHLARLWIPGAWSDEIVFDLAFIPARYSANRLEVLLDGIFPFVTYGFLHANFAHLALNCLWLLAFGPAVARRMGTLRFLSFFFLCGVGAAVAHLLVYWGSPGLVIGASGSVAGLMAAGMRILYGERHRVHRVETGLAPIFFRPLVVFTALWVGMNVAVGLTGFGMTGDLSAIAWVAHLGGYFTGLLTVGLFARRPTLSFV